MAIAFAATMNPATASAAEYTVNSLGDQVDEAPGSNGCKTAATTCTLRASIEESNASSGINDTIKFAFTFNGEIDDTIELNTPLPAIVDQVRIEGNPSTFQCETDFAAEGGPCVGINGPAGDSALRIETERVVIKGLAITNAQTAIKAIHGPGLEAWNNWIGVKLNGSAGPNGTGIFIDQHSNGATIGAISSIGRNIVANNVSEGLDLEGADNAVVLGNGFGVMPNGNGQAANGTNIEITDSAMGDKFEAKNNWIGRTVNDEELETPLCDGGCNVIAGAVTSGIDLSGDGGGEAPASGPTWIHGNYIGLNAFGTAGIPNAIQGVLVGEASDVTLGGPDPGDFNNINGSSFGMVAGPGAEGLIVKGNRIGVDPTGTKGLAPPATVGLAIDSGEAPNDFAEITGNWISMQGGTAIQQHGEGAVIESNEIGQGVHGEILPGGEIGIWLFGTGLLGNLISDNSINNAGTYGVLIENDNNGVYGNQIVGSGEAGIRIQASPDFDPTGNWIGDPAGFRENTIAKTAGNAIEIATSSSLGNVIDRNIGSDNSGLFIDLGDDGLGNDPSGPNDGIQAPVISQTTRSIIAGSARPGASVLVFTKATPSMGEIASYLGRVSADFDGTWTLTLKSPLAAGSLVSATQTFALMDLHNEIVRGSSELAFATIPTEPEVPGGAKGDDTGPSIDPVCLLFGSRPCPQDRAAPQTMIERGPSGNTGTRSNKFRFSSSEPGSHFECKLDRRPTGQCKSPKTYGKLKPGRHIFKVWATDDAGNKDQSPAKRRFHVIEKPGKSESPDSSPVSGPCIPLTENCL